MGIPRFYRWLSERYPLINEFITAEQIPEFDNLYLDMNGIIHTCSHNNTGGLCVKDEREVYLEVFSYIVRLFSIIRPKRLLYLAVDGCAPRAKMNQQRSRRFRAANDAREALERALEMGEEVSGTPFDSNCITPGTEFMGKLLENLQFFVQKKIQEDPLWQGLDVVLSGPDVPGEGEHKIMDYIRLAKSQPGYDPDTRHCLYGLDADLIMLALASHEPHFALLREEVVFGKQATKRLEQRLLFSKSRFQLLHVSLVREYLDLEFAAVKEASLPFDYSLERIIDDFILFCVLVGNDFLPCLPLAEIGEGGLDIFLTTYKEHLQGASASRLPWLTGSCGEVQFDQFALFLKKYAETEHAQLETSVEGNGWVLGRRRTVGPRDAADQLESDVSAPLESPPNAELARTQYYSVKFGMDTNTHEGTQTQRSLFRSYLEGLQWVLYYYFRGPDNASWSWYFPFYHAPMAFDLASYDQLAHPEVRFQVDAPFRPFQQLMAVLPASSKVLLPECYRWLFDSPESPILHFYPQQFQIDIDGVKVPWGGVTLIPWIEPGALLRAMGEAESRGPPLAEAERLRNAVGRAFCFRYDLNESAEVASTVPERFKSIPRCTVRRSVFSHPTLPADMPHFHNGVLPGCTAPAPGFPTLALHPLTGAFETGIKVFQYEARGESLVVHLHPDGAIVPKPKEIQNTIGASHVLISYPTVHRGQVVAVHTAGTTFTPGGKTASNYAPDHAPWVWQLAEEWRKRGLAVDFDGATEDQALQQAIAEVRAVESSYVDGDSGQMRYTFGSKSEFCSMQILRGDKDPPIVKPRTLGERFPVGSPALCIAGESEAFGQIGLVEKSSDSAESVEACFRLGLARAEQEALERDVQRTVEKHQNAMRWRDLGELAKEAQLSLHVAKQVLGSLMARDAENVREDVGMSLMCETTEGDATVSLCLPTYSVRWDGVWMFSDLAAEALKDYIAKFPGFFLALKDRRNLYRDFDLRLAFPESTDPEYATRQLVKYCAACPFKRLRLAPADHTALPAPGVAEVVRLVDAARSKLEAQPVRLERIAGSGKLFPAGDARRRLPSRLLPAASEVELGHRGVCVDTLGSVPRGARGTVLGVYGSGEAQLLEILLDEETFGATDLNGRTPAMRGVQVPVKGFMPCHPRRAAAARGAAVSSAPAAEAPVQNGTDGQRKPPARGRPAKGTGKGKDAAADWQHSQPIGNGKDAVADWQHSQPIGSYPGGGQASSAASASAPWRPSLEAALQLPPARPAARQGRGGQGQAAGWPRQQPPAPLPQTWWQTPWTSSSSWDPNWDPTWEGGWGGLDWEGQAAWMADAARRAPQGGGAHSYYY